MDRQDGFGSQPHVRRGTTNLRTVLAGRGHWYADGDTLTARMVQGVSREQVQPKARLVHLETS